MIASSLCMEKMEKLGETMKYEIKFRFRPLFVMDTIRVVPRGEVEPQVCCSLHEANRQAKAAVSNGALSATVYEVVDRNTKKFKLRWESREDQTVLISGV